MNITSTCKKLFSKAILITSLVLTILLTSGGYIANAQTTPHQAPSDMYCVKCR
jgi:hypothetical protein